MSFAYISLLLQRREIGFRTRKIVASLTTEPSCYNEKILDDALILSVRMNQLEYSDLI